MALLYSTLFYSTLLHSSIVGNRVFVFGELSCSVSSVLWGEAKLHIIEK